MLSCASAFVGPQMPTRSLRHDIARDSQTRSQLTQLNAEKSDKVDKSASVCVSDFFSSSGKSSTPSSSSKLAAVRVAGVDALGSAKLPFGKDEAWR